MDTGAIERLGERMKQSRAQEATITREVAQPTGERIIDTPEQIEDIERRADYMRNHGAQDSTIVKETSDEDIPAEDKRTRGTEEEQDYQREIDAIIKAQRQRQLDWERGIEPERGNDRDLGYGIE